jgi:hypothetical protein
VLLLPARSIIIALKQTLVRVMKRPPKNERRNAGREIWGMEASDWADEQIRLGRRDAGGSL